MGECAICGLDSELVSHPLGLCASCILANTKEARRKAESVHAISRKRFNLPFRPPRNREGISCRQCINTCRIAPGECGYCGARRNENGGIAGGGPVAAAVEWYHDPLPTNCVADWVCPASGPAGYPDFTDTKGPEHGHLNLAVFYEACTFDCLFCQNWHFKYNSKEGPRRSATELAEAANPRTRCICFFGGDPSCQIDHAIHAAKFALKAQTGRILRICWETNGSMSPSKLKDMAALSLDSGGCIKFDLKAWDDSLHRALCGVSNRRTLKNFEFLSNWIDQRPDPPFLVASTLLVPGYVDSKEVAQIAGFIARLDPGIPYALLAFHPAFEMSDLPPTSKKQAEECFHAASSAGLTRVRIGNLHLLW